ncbi:MAG: DsbA family oxidoreductase [Hyphomicrobiales bacterium]|nr:DsbA family oxidoreductase [Hyphomicrobiales bacterium]
MTPLAIHVISDVVCPWCYLGRNRLAAALAQNPEVDAIVDWKSFRLDPTIPMGGIPREQYLSNKFGSVEATRPMYDQLIELGTEEGIAFRFDRITRSPNTVDAHRLIRWSAKDGKQDAVVEGLFKAYFTEGLDVGERRVLLAVAEDAGLRSQSIATRLSSEEDIAVVEAEIEHAYHIGVSGVPCFILGGRYVVTGAQPARVLADAIRTVAAEADFEPSALPN